MILIDFAKMRVIGMFLCILYFTLYLCLYIDLRFEENDGKYDQNQSGHDTTFEGGNVELSKRSDGTCMYMY